MVVKVEIIEMAAQQFLRCHLLLNPLISHMFTPVQVEFLEKSFQQNKQLKKGPEAIEVGESIGLTEAQVVSWFARRRMKDKEEQQQPQHDIPSVGLQDLEDAAKLGKMLLSTYKEQVDKQYSDAFDAERSRLLDPLIKTSDQSILKRYFSC